MWLKIQPRRLHLTLFNLTCACKKNNSLTLFLTTVFDDIKKKWKKKNSTNEFPSSHTTKYNNWI